LIIESVPAPLPQCYEVEANRQRQAYGTVQAEKAVPVTEAERRRELEEVERQQQDFGIQ
jgi:hypothetical protein